MGAAYLGPKRTKRGGQPIGLAVTSLVLAILGCCAGIVPLIMSWMALSRVRRGIGGGKPIAIAAMVISIMYLLVTVFGTAIAFRLLAKRDFNGQVTEAGWLPASDLRTGDCLNRPGSSPLFIKVVPCGLPHETEAFQRLPATNVPNSEMAVLCAPGFRQYVGIKPGNSELVLMAVRVPQSTFGEAEGIACLVGQQDDQEIAGTLRNARR